MLNTSPGAIVSAFAPSMAFILGSTLWLSLLFPGEIHSQQGGGDLADKSAEELKKTYDSIEAVLLKRLKERSSLNPQAVESTIDALGEIRSKKAVPILLEMLDFSNVVSKDINKPTPVGGKYVLWTDFYPSLKSLINIAGISIPEIIQQLEKAERGSSREELLVVLGWKLHGAAFENRVKSLAADKTRKDSAMWQKLFEKYLGP